MKPHIGIPTVVLREMPTAILRLKPAIGKAVFGQIGIQWKNKVD
jgi:hypothetical protein